MQIRQFTVVGQGVDELAYKFAELWDNAKILQTSMVGVVSVENYSVRNNSNVLIVVIFSLADKFTCDIAVISGGGRRGLLGVDWGVEGNRLQRAVDQIEKICDSKGWQYHDD